MKLVVHGIFLDPSLLGHLSQVAIEEIQQIGHFSPVLELSRLGFLLPRISSQELPVPVSSVFVPVPSKCLEFVPSLCGSEF